MNLTSKYKKSEAVFLCFNVFYSLILRTEIVIYLFFVIVNEWQYFETASSYSPSFEMKIMHMTTLKIYDVNALIM